MYVCVYMYIYMCMYIDISHAEIGHPRTSHRMNICQNVAVLQSIATRTPISSNHASRTSAAALARRQPHSSTMTMCGEVSGCAAVARCRNATTCGK